MSPSVAPGLEAASNRDVAQRKQPGVLYMLFGTEAWERFSFYGMRAILKLYLMKGLLFSQGKASLVYGFYSGLVYLTPLLGGLLADRFIGYRAAVLSGGLIMAGGQFFLSGGTETTFWAGVSLLILGNGLFKANISTIVGTLYDDGDPRRDRGFTIFYMGINLGAGLAPWICGQLLGENEAWLGSHAFSWGFRAAGIGMIIGVLTFFIGQRWLGDRDRRRPRSSAQESTSSAHGNQTPPPSAGLPTSAPGRRSTLDRAEPLSAVERGRIACILLVGAFVIFFWMAFEQAGNTMTTWADESTNRMIGGWEIKASLFQSVNPVFIIILAPIVSHLWQVLGERGKEPSSPAKMGLGLVFLGLGFVPLAIAALEAGPSGRASWIWLVLAYFIQTIGELCLSPVGLSLVTKLAPKRLAALLMGVWFLSVWAGNTLAGVTGYWYDKVPHATFFTLFVLSSILAGAALLALLKPVKRLMAGVH